MPDPVTTIGVGAVAAYLGKDGLQKLLGPTADYLGGGLKDFTQHRLQAIGKIFGTAQARLGEKINQPGEVPPKVLKAVLDEGSFSSDPLALEYFGGILASARTEHGRDDRSARLAKLVDAMSTYQLRAHYLVYTTVRKSFSELGLPFNMVGRPKMALFVSLDSFIEAMDFNQTELNQISQLLNHIFFGLHGDNLLEGNWQYGPKDHMVTIFPKAETSGILFAPSALGAELYLSAFGVADQPLEYIFSPALSVALTGIPEGFEGAISTKA